MATSEDLIMRQFWPQGRALYNIYIFQDIFQITFCHIFRHIRPEWVCAATQVRHRKLQFIALLKGIEYSTHPNENDLFFSFNFVSHLGNPTFNTKVKYIQPMKTGPILVTGLLICLPKVKITDLDSCLE